MRRASSCQTVPFWTPFMGQLGPVLEPTRDEHHHDPRHDANPSKWDSPAPPSSRAERRPREYLTPKEVERLICALRWDQVNFG